MAECQDSLVTCKLGPLWRPYEQEPLNEESFQLFHGGFECKTVTYDCCSQLTVRTVFSLAPATTSIIHVLSKLPRYDIPFVDVVDVVQTGNTAVTTHWCARTGEPGPLRSATCHAAGGTATRVSDLHCDIVVKPIALPTDNESCRVVRLRGTQVGRDPVDVGHRLWAQGRKIVVYLGFSKESDGCRNSVASLLPCCSFPPEVQPPTKSPRNPGAAPVICRVVAFHILRKAPRATCY
ncbi:hypothetical protein CC86DRAFT_379417 [Ophiobolus disseminans]|uniref:Uncharacterized protein n=1 Tax=Ophiobolus disseminans TaxID=1469910 RepID=A0A6A7AB61_9PLEO|nr:hypothetical protein CC86DRAFT_379417 [Ophiobolus disseminans]